MTALACTAHGMCMRIWASVIHMATEFVAAVLAASEARVALVEDEVGGAIHPAERKVVDHLRKTHAANLTLGGEFRVSQVAVRV